MGVVWDGTRGRDAEQLQVSQPSSESLCCCPGQDSAALLSRLSCHAEPWTGPSRDQAFCPSRPCQLAATQSRRLRCGDLRLAASHGHLLRVSRTRPCQLMWLCGTFFFGCYISLYILDLDLSQLCLHNISVYIFYLDCFPQCGEEIQSSLRW